MDWGEVLSHAEAFGHALQSSQSEGVKGYLASEHQAEILKVLDGLEPINKTQVMTVTPVGRVHLPSDSDGPRYISIISLEGSKESLLRTTWVESSDGNRLIISDAWIVG